MQSNVKPPSAVQIPLSWQAQGMLCHLREHPEMKLTVANLVKVTKGAARETGRDGVYSIINELINTGYLVRHLRQREEGKMIGAIYELHPPNNGALDNQ